LLPPTHYKSSSPPTHHHHVITGQPTEELELKKITLFDLNDPAAVDDAVLADTRIEWVKGDLTDKETIEKVVAPDGCTRVSVIHLAALLSGYSEVNFDLGMKVNLFGTLNVMERVRSLCEVLGGPQIYLYVSTDYVACYNEFNKANAVTEESFRLSPVSYGCQKACNELLISDYTRKGFLDGRVCRLSAVIGRPGFSNSISYPYTGIFTQTLNDAEKVYGVSLPMDRPYPCSALNTNVKALYHMVSSVDGAAIGHNRVVQMPCKSWTLSDIWAATQEVAKEEGIPLGTIKEIPADQGETTVQEIDVCPAVSCEKARGLGCPMETDLKDVIRDYINEHVKK
jgi:nucleoside-diphosphate-sugar epimerase